MDKKQLKAYVDEQVFKEFKIIAIQEDKSISEYIELLLKQEIEKQKKRYV